MFRCLDRGWACRPNPKVPPPWEGRSLLGTEDKLFQSPGNVAKLTQLRVEVPQGMFWKATGIINIIISAIGTNPGPPTTQP